jgi:hypothetical protein
MLHFVSKSAKCKVLVGPSCIFYLIDFVEVLIIMLKFFSILYVVKLVLIEKSRVEDERKVEELTQKLEEALALRQEAEAKLAHAEKKLCELEHLPGNVKVSQFCSYHHIINVICIFCMCVHIPYSVIMLTNCGSTESMCVYTQHHHHLCVSMLRSVHSFSGLGVYRA